MLLRPPLPAEQIPRTSLAAGLAVARSVFRATGIRCGLKWPNDVMLRGRKVAGVLAEAYQVDRQIGFVVLGVGVNLTVADWPPELLGVGTSLAAEGTPVRPAHLVPVLLEELERDYSRLLAGQWDKLRAEWRAASVTMGRPVIARGPAGELAGRARDLGPAGELMLERDDGTLVAVVAGDVSLSQGVSVNDDHSVP